MKVQSITARFLRKIQVQQFEPQEAELSVTVVSTEDEPMPGIDGTRAITDKLLKDLRDSAFTVLTNKAASQTPGPITPTTTSVAPPTKKDETPKPPVAPVTQEATPADDGKKGKAGKKEKPVAPTSEIPDAASTTPAETAPATTPAKAAAASEIPDAASVPTPPAPKSGEASMTPTELQAYVTEEIKGKRLNVPQMRDVMTEFNIVRLGDLTTPEKLKEFKAKIDAVIVTNGHKPGGK